MAEKLRIHASIGLPPNDANSVQDGWVDHPAAMDLSTNADLARRNAEYICEKLDGINFNPNPWMVPLRPVVLPSSVRSTLDNASKFLIELIHRVCWSLSDQPAELTRRVGLRPSQVPLLGAGGIQHDIDYSACNGRLDVLLQNGKPMFLEANFSAANVDPVVTHFQLEAYKGLYGITPVVDENSAGEPFEARARFYRKVLRERNAPPSIAIVGTAYGSSVGDHRYYEAEANFLRERGFSSDLLEPSQFATSRIAGSYSIALKHFLSEYWEQLKIPIDSMAVAHKDTFFLVPDSGRALSSKLVLAWLSEGSVPLSDSERSFVARHIPWTRLIEVGDVEFEGRTWSLRDLALAKRRDFVLKPLTCCGGKGVLIGRIESPERWQRCIEETIERRDCVLQQFVETDILAMDFFDRKTGSVCSANVSYVLGAYFVDGVSAGASIRHFPHSSPGVVNLDRGASFNVVI